MLNMQVEKRLNHDMVKRAEFDPPLSLADQARRNIQEMSEHDLAHALAFTARTNITRLHRTYGGEAKFVELAQCPLIHEARVVKI